ncbi:MAG: hypothetical protein GXP45_06340 [bacterium]|nr:hypothetical protein [bacterium]
MGLLFLFVSLMAFTLFFYGIGLRYLGLIPLLFFVILIAYYTTTLSLKDKVIKVFEKHGMLIAWFILLGGLLGIFHFIGMSTLLIAKILFVLNLILWVVSYLLKYEDGKIMFQIGYYLALILLFVVGAWG